MKRGRCTVRISVPGLSLLCGLLLSLPGVSAADPVFLRGDANADGQVSISDVVIIRNTPVNQLPCAKAADIADDGGVGDAEDSTLMEFLFRQLHNADFPSPRAPFPEPGTDPQPDSLPCSGYVVQPPAPAPGFVRIGQAVGSPGQIVETPVYLTNSEEVEALQFVICYDAELFHPLIDPFDNDGDLVNLDGTFYESLPWKSWFGTNLPQEQAMALGFFGNYFGSGYNLPPGADRLVLKIRWKVFSTAAPDSVIAPRLTNGVEGRGVYEPYNLRNELTVAGKATLLEVPSGNCVSPPIENRFLRGDINVDGRVSLSDASMLRRLLSGTQGVLDCFDAADTNDDGKLNASDAISFLIAMFLSVPPVPPLAAPFPLAGDDPTADRVGCLSYNPVPPQETDDVVRVGEVEAAPGQEVLIPIYLTSSQPVEAFQLVISWEPRYFTSLRKEFSGTIWEQFYEDHQPHGLAVLRGDQRGFILVAVMGSLEEDGYEVPPGSEVLVMYMRATISPDAEPGTIISLDLTNGPGEEGVLPPYNLRNELTVQGTAKFLSVLPRRISGKIAIIDDITFFIRGDANADRRVDVSDAVFTIGHLFLGGEAPRCPDAEDADDNGRLELTDAVVILGQLFTAEGTIAEPYPAAGQDGTFDNLTPCRN